MEKKGYWYVKNSVVSNLIFSGNYWLFYKEGACSGLHNFTSETKTILSIFVDLKKRIDRGSNK
jgi:hypothetical protein